ncbi:MAG: F0F1 ATP synthase subunit delta [Erysipelotrichales bacterium]|nr:F0F1 ATP synthase subunit delta [Erysipelotrichales bacterium]
MDSVASRYAIALLSLAREENCVKEYISECEQVVEVLDQNSDLEKILRDYGLSLIEKKETLDLCFKGKVSEYVLNFFYIIIDNKRGNLFKSILLEFVRIGYKELNIKKGTIYSTIKLTEKEIKDIEKRTSEILHSTVVLDNKLDEKLIGGFKIQVEDMIIDESIKKRLDDLKTNLLKEGSN